MSSIVVQVTCGVQFLTQCAADLVHVLVILHATPAGGKAVGSQTC